MCMIHFAGYWPTYYLFAWMRPTYVPSTVGELTPQTHHRNAYPEGYIAIRYGKC